MNKHETPERLLIPKFVGCNTYFPGIRASVQGKRAVYALYGLSDEKYESSKKRRIRDQGLVLRSEALLRRVALGNGYGAGRGLANG